jgi:CRISPR-associated endonuclease/helicase Cas3
VANSGLIPAGTAEFTGPTSLFGFLKEPTPLQKACLELPIGDGAQLHILEDVTGAGKTEAAMILLARMMAADQAQGAYIALPTMATANAMYSRTASVYRKLYRHGEARPSLVLAHGGRHLDDQFKESLIHSGQLPAEGDYEADEYDAEARCNAWLADNNKKAMLSQIGVGTIDQALLAVLQSRHQSLRLLGLIDKVLIVDEVHASDAYMHSLLCQLLCLHACAGGSAILLSATLPASIRNELIEWFGGSDPAVSKPPKNLDYPLLTSVAPSEAPNFQPVSTRESVRRRLEVQLTQDECQARGWILEKANEGHCVAWIRNTVNDAIDAWQRLSAELGDERVMLFHARFAMGDRLDIEREVLSAFGPESSADTRAGRVVIATQVIEQSLDLDFDEMLSDLAPVDLLIQRAGRLKRHVRDPSGNRVEELDTDQRGSPCLHVLSPPPEANADKHWIRRLLPGTGTVYPDHGRLWLTASELSARGHIRIPEDLRELIESVYGETAVDRIPEALALSNARAEGKALSDRSVARLNAIKLATGYTCQDGQWADESKTPTRLGDPSVTIRLGRWQDGAITPWCNQEANPWPLSELKIAARLFSEPVIQDPELQQALDELRAAWPKALRHMHVLPLSNVDDRWIATARDAQGRLVRFEYSPVVGLRILKEETS